MLLLGLTGSIATGKSTVSNLLRSPPYNLPIIDADVLARQVVEPGTAGYKKIVEYFGPSTPDLLLPIEDPACGNSELGKDGKGRPLNRPALGRRVFGSEEEKVRDRKMLGSFIHPAVGREIWKAMVRHYSSTFWLWLYSGMGISAHVAWANL
jgi:dephospho-CoA kinase